MRRFLFLAACLLLYAGVWGQQPVATSALKDTEFIIKKEHKHLLPESSRLFEGAPTSPCVTDPIHPLEYTLPTLYPKFDTLPRKTKIFRAKQDMIAKLYSNYLQGGHGNFYMPFLEGHFANKHHAQYAYGLQIRHLSAGTKAYNEEHHHLIQLHGKLLYETLCLGGEVAYNRDKYPLYNPEDGTVATPRSKTWDQFSTRYTLSNYVHGMFNYQVDAVLHYCTDTDQAHELQGGLNGQGDYTLNDAFTLSVFTDLHLTKYSNITAVHRNLWRFKPMLSFLYNRFDVQGGVNLVYHNDASYVTNALHVYPVWEVKYTLYKWLQPYIGLSGDIQRNSLQGFLQENPLLAPQTTLCHTNQRFVFYGGARGDIVEQVSWHAGLSVGTYDNLHCWVNSDKDPRQFNVEYAPTATLLNTFGALTHTNRAETLTIRLRGDHFQYTLPEPSKPWHRPHYQLDLLSTYRLYDRFMFRSSLCWVGGLSAWDVTKKVPVVLPDVVDVGLGIDYRLDARLAIFCNFQNLLARNNERYLHYPSRGFHCMVGLTYAW